MVDTIFELTRVDSFYDDMNREDCFDTMDMDGVTPNFKIVLVSDCASDITDCIDEDGTIKTPYDADTGKGCNIIDTTSGEDGLCSMLWSKGINSDRSMTITSPLVTYSLGETIAELKAIFLVAVADGTGYVMAYAINNRSLTITGELILPIEGAVWTIRQGD